MKFLPNILRVQKKERTVFQIILWWEFRRIIYNMVLFIAVALCLQILGMKLSEIEMGDGEYFIFIVLVGIVIFSNLFYTLGWITELFITRSDTYGPKVFKLALTTALLLLAFFVTSIYLLIQ